MKKEKIIAYCMRKKYVTAAQIGGLVARYQDLPQQPDFLEFIASQLSWNADFVKKIRHDFMMPTLALTEGADLNTINFEQNSPSSPAEEFAQVVKQLVSEKKITTSQAPLLLLLFQEKRIDQQWVERTFRENMATAQKRDVRSTDITASDPSEEKVRQKAAVAATVTFSNSLFDGTPKKIDAYILGKKLGAGGMGAVYEARHEKTGEVVALKMLQPASGVNPSAAIKRFAQEIMIHQELNHPNIVRLLDWGRQENTPYMIMEYVAGVSIDQMIEKYGKLDLRRSLSLLLPVVKALEYALQSNIIHRDIKPGNIMVDISRGKVKLADMGLGKIAQESGLTVSGQILGSPYYMAPEQVTSTKNVDHRADIYSIGATLYHMLTGVPPYDGIHPYQVLQIKASQHRGPVPLESLTPGLPPALIAMVAKMMAMEATDRYQTLTEVRQEMQKILDTL